jgi:hypothetical protein
MKRFWVVVIIIVAVGAGIAINSNTHKSTTKPSSATSAKKTSSSTTTTKKQKEIAYHAGDTQTSGNLSITLDSTSFATTMRQLADNETIFSVSLTIKNNGTTPFTSKDAFVKLSSVYTQVGADTSTGHYSPAYTSPCFGGGEVVIAPSKSVSGCVQFVVPKNASVDTYFYNKLKWFL